MTRIHAADDATRFCGEFVLGNRKPVTQVRKFQATSGPTTLKLYNGAGGMLLGQASQRCRVSVNSARVFRTSRVNERVGPLRATVALKQGSNELKIGFKGKPGAKIRLKIIQQAETSNPFRVSVASDGTQADNDSGGLSISGDGKSVVFGEFYQLLSDGNGHVFVTYP